MEKSEFMMLLASIPVGNLRNERHELIEEKHNQTTKITLERGRSGGA